MQRSFHDQIIEIERRIKVLRDSLTGQGRTEAQRTKIQSDIETAELALAHLRRVLETEKELA